MTDPLVNFNHHKIDLNIKLNRRFLRRSRTTCWQSWLSRGAPSWSGWSWSSGGCLGLLPLSYTSHPGMNMPRGYKHAVGSKSSWNHLLTHIFVIFALMIKPHHQGCQEVTICSSLILRDSKDLQSRWCCDCRPSKLLCVGFCPLKPWYVYVWSMWRV